jgi:hypothetical protein
MSEETQEKQEWPAYIPRSAEAIRSMTAQQLPPPDTLLKSTKERIFAKIRESRYENAKLPEKEVLRTHIWRERGIQSLDPMKALEDALWEFKHEWGWERDEAMKRSTGGKEKAVVLDPISCQREFEIERKLHKCPIGTPIWVLPLTNAEGEVIEHNVLLTYASVDKVVPSPRYFVSDALKDVMIEDLCPTEEEAL